MSIKLNRNLLSIAILNMLLLGGLDAFGASLVDVIPQYTPDGELIKPANYREWILISTGIGMSYGPLQPKPDKSPAFTNVFVNPSAYQHFLKTGGWPDKTIFIRESRESIALNNSTTGNNGYYQGEVIGMEAHVKDASHFKNSWAFFDFGTTNHTSGKIPEMADCYSCHAKNAAVDTTFVQFYPVLRDVAKKKGTFKTVPDSF